MKRPFRAVFHIRDISGTDMVSNDYLVRGTAQEGRVRIFALDATATVETLRARHQTEPAVTAALGRTALGALLLGAMLKQASQLVTLRVNGGGPAGVLLASANGAGDVRGLVANPRPAIEQVREDGKLNVSGAVGSSGHLTVTRELGMRAPYSSTVEMVSGEIGEDLAWFFASSEQVPSAVGIGVFVRVDGTVEAAGGYIVQLVGGLSDEEAEQVERAIRALPHPTTMLRQGDTPETMLERIFPTGLDLLGRTPVRFHCPCTLERAERALVLLDAGELEDVRESDARRGFTELVCQFCGEQYRISPDELERLIGEAG
ncbi:MAG TPA: Hsp33 family molecular chaperone HslO [Longimicrobiales bacterium]|nr:Hsp33 family molecular chaperone HslO [Longimicrobiales bacterium]